MGSEEPSVDADETDSIQSGEFSAHLNRKVMGIWLAVSLVATVLEAFALLVGVGSAIDWFLLVAFAAISAVLALHVFDKRPVLIVNQDGIHDRRISRGMISWDDVLWHKMEAQAAVPILGVGLTDSVARQVGVHPWAIQFKNQPAPFGKIKGYRIWPHRTHGKGHEFVRAVQRFAPIQHDK